jgi:hypothetical protein
MTFIIPDKILSTKNRKIPNIKASPSTTNVDPFSSSHVGQETLLISNCTSEKNCFIFFTMTINKLCYPLILAGEAGLEPATLGVGDRCSTN